MPILLTIVNQLLISTINRIHRTYLFPAITNQPILPILLDLERHPPSSPAFVLPQALPSALHRRRRPRACAFLPMHGPPCSSAGHPHWPWSMRCRTRQHLASATASTLIIGGIDIPHDHGCDNHSDGRFLFLDLNRRRCSWRRTADGHNRGGPPAYSTVSRSAVLHGRSTTGSGC